MGYCGTLAGLAIANLIDSQSNYWGGGLPVLYRTKNFDIDAQTEGVSELGFTSYSLTGAPISGALTGTKDIQVCPQPSYQSLSMRFIEDAINSGVALRWGARKFIFSANWVKSVMAQRNYTDPKYVFIDTSVVGFVNEGRLWQVESYLPDEIYGSIVSWTILANAGELK